VEDKTRLQEEIDQIQRFQESFDELCTRYDADTPREGSITPRPESPEDSSSSEEEYELEGDSD
jgi:hypothetical protein